MWKRCALVMVGFAVVAAFGFGSVDATVAAEAESVGTFDANESGDAIGLIQLALAAVSVVTLVLLVGYLRHTSPRRRHLSEPKGTV